jgi:uncharacterized protein DUF3846
MKGDTLTMLVITHNGELVSTQIKPDDLDAMQAAVGGYIEPVPFWHEFEIDGKKRPCWVFCDEEGKLKGKPVNLAATELWRQYWTIPVADVLVGDVAIIYGPRHLMEQL